MAMLNNQRVFITQASISAGSQSRFHSRPCKINKTQHWLVRNSPNCADYLHKNWPLFTLFQKMLFMFFQLYSGNVDTQHIKWFFDLFFSDDGSPADVDEVVMYISIMFHAGLMRQIQLPSFDSEFDDFLAILMLAFEIGCCTTIVACVPYFSRFRTIGVLPLIFETRRWLTRFPSFTRRLDQQRIIFLG